MGNVLEEEFDDLESIANEALELELLAQELDARQLSREIEPYIDYALAMYKSGKFGEALEELKKMESYYPRTLQGKKLARFIHAKRAKRLLFGGRAEWHQIIYLLEPLEKTGLMSAESYHVLAEANLELWRSLPLGSPAEPDLRHPLKKRFEYANGATTAIGKAISDEPDNPLHHLQAAQIGLEASLRCAGELQILLQTAAQTVPVKHWYSSSERQEERRQVIESVTHAELKIPEVHDRLRHAQQATMASLAATYTFSFGHEAIVARIRATFAQLIECTNDLSPVDETPLLEAGLFLRERPALNPQPD